MSDIQRMCGSFDPPVTEGNLSILTGSAPVATMRGYQREVNAFTRGLGRLSCILKGYEPCHNAEEIIRETGYDAERDLENPSSSVFCAHGAGFVVNWREVPDYAHLENSWSSAENAEKENSDETGMAFRAVQAAAVGGNSQTGSGRNDYITQEEIEEIFQRTYGKSVQEYAPYRHHQQNTGSTAGGQEKPAEKDAVSEKNWNSGQASAKERYASDLREKYFLVDGYNIIFAWEDLRSLAEINIDSARDRLMDICCNYQGYDGATLILVFDAYKVKGNPGSVQKYHNIYVVYTREAETADQYIEKTVHKIGRKHHVTVATSDALEQMIIWGDGAVRLSAGGFREAVREAEQRMREEYKGDKKLSHKICIPESKK